MIFQSTRPVRGGTGVVEHFKPLSNISIHPPRAGRDLTVNLWYYTESISIHPPRAGRDNITVEFLSQN